MRLLDLDHIFRVSLHDIDASRDDLLTLNLNPKGALK